jgi:hypothetical protein
MLLTILLLAHSFYPPYCCNEQDCRPVPCNEISFTTSHVIWRGLYGIKWATYLSPDGQCHVCTSSIALRCVFIPERLS